MPQLLINIIDAQNIAETELLGKQDPYVVICTDCDRQETFVCKDGGRNPRWNTEKTVSYNDPNSNIQFYIVNKNLLKDNNIGTVTYSLSTLMASGGFVDAFLPVISLKRQKGTLHVVMRCVAQYVTPNPVPAAVPVAPPPTGAYYPPPPPGPGPHPPPPPPGPGPHHHHPPPPPGPHHHHPPPPPGPHHHHPPPPPGPHHHHPPGPPGPPGPYGYPPRR